MDHRPDRPHRPAPYADLTGFIDAAGGVAPSSRAEVAAATAAVLVQVGRAVAGSDTADPRTTPEPAAADSVERFVQLVDRIGIDTLGALWRDSDPVSLPGALWALYLLRQWCQANPLQVSMLWRSGAPLAAADAAVAGVADPGDPDAMRGAADAILGRLFRGDVAVALERAAAMFRVLAAGRRDHAESGDPDARADELARAERNHRVGDDLTAAARRWRNGTLH